MPPAASLPDLPIPEMVEVAVALFAIDWYTTGQGYLECPGISKHTGADGKRDCRVMLGGGKPPTIKCFHAKCAPDIADANFRLRSAIGKAKVKHGWRPEPGYRPAEKTSAERPAPPEFNLELLERFAGRFAKLINLPWLADRSVEDPATVDGHRYLEMMYRADEHVVVFTDDKSQGQALWPGEALPDTGLHGVWYLAQPVDGDYHMNPRRKVPAPSRRSQESVTSWRYMVLESDEAPVRAWLGALVQLPLRIAAIYTSGGRSVHALIKIDAPTKDAWDQEKRQLTPGLLMLGADPGALSAVRLTRLPNCYREGKTDKHGTYHRFPNAELQKLLYINPAPEIRPLVDVFARRDTIQSWLKWAALGISDADETGGELLKRALRFYSTVSVPCRFALARLEEIEQREAA